MREVVRIHTKSQSSVDTVLSLAARKALPTAILNRNLETIRKFGVKETCLIGIVDTHMAYACRVDSINVCSK